MSYQPPKSGQRRRRRREISGDRAAAAVATVEILPGMIPDEDTLAEGIENLEAALKKKKQPERLSGRLQALSSRDLIEQAKRSALMVPTRCLGPSWSLIDESCGGVPVRQSQWHLGHHADGHGFSAPSRTRSCLRRMMFTSRLRSSKNWNFDGDRKSKGGPLPQQKTTRVGSALLQVEQVTVLRQKRGTSGVENWCPCTPTAIVLDPARCSRDEWSTLSHRWGLAASFDCGPLGRARRSCCKDDCHL